VKLADFGISRRPQGSASHTGRDGGIPHGTAQYMAPEIICEQTYSFKSDIWSLGCVLLEMLTGKMPYADLTNALAVMYKLSSESPQIPTDLAPEVQEFLQACMQRDPRLRPTAAELLGFRFLAGVGSAPARPLPALGALESWSPGSEKRSAQHPGQRDDTAALDTASPSMSSSPSVRGAHRPRATSAVFAREDQPHAIFAIASHLSIRVVCILTSVASESAGSALKMTSYLTHSRLSQDKGVQKVLRLIMRPPHEDSMDLVRQGLLALRPLDKADEPLLDTLLGSAREDARAVALKTVFGSTGKLCSVLMLCSWDKGSLGSQLSPHLQR